MTTVNLRHYDNGWYDPGGSFLRRTAWFFLGLPLLRARILPFSGLRVTLLRAFGATIGDRVVIKPGVEVKYPWHLRIGSDCWIGESAWIDNLTTVQLHDNVCISQGAYLCTGNHDWTDPAFGLRIAPVTLHAGSWAGARSILLPGAVLMTNAIAAAGAVVAGTIPANEIHAGNPATFLRRRILRTPVSASPTDASQPAQEVCP